MVSRDDTGNKIRESHTHQVIEHGICLVRARVPSPEARRPGRSLSCCAPASRHRRDMLSVCEQKQTRRSAGHVPCIPVHGLVWPRTGLCPLFKWHLLLAAREPVLGCADTSLWSECTTFEFRVTWIRIQISECTHAIGRPGPGIVVVVRKKKVDAFGSNKMDAQQPATSTIMQDSQNWQFSPALSPSGCDKSPIPPRSCLRTGLAADRTAGSRSMLASGEVGRTQRGQYAT